MSVVIQRLKMIQQVQKSWYFNIVFLSSSMFLCLIFSLFLSGKSEENFCSRIRSKRKYQECEGITCRKCWLCFFPRLTSKHLLTTKKRTVFFSSSYFYIVPHLFDCLLKVHQFSSFFLFYLQTPSIFTSFAQKKGHFKKKLFSNPFCFCNVLHNLLYGQVFDFVRTLFGNW